MVRSADPPERAPGQGEMPRCAYEQHELTGRIVYIKPTIYGSEPRDVFKDFT